MAENPKQSLIIDNRYNAVKKLGSGLSGEVWQVTDTEGEKALKLLNRVQMNVSREEALASFKSEFSILSELNHPGINRILDFGYDESQNRHFFTSELIIGSDFFSGTEGLGPEAIEELAVQIFRALNYLHSRGVYHLDIKPQNILVKNGGVAKLIDFGLAGFSSDRKQVGTPAYMAPEMILKGALDGRTDLYSFGVVLYKAFTRENPFVSKELRETMERQRNFVPKPASEINPAVPKFWDRILARLLQKSPSERYPDAASVIRDINFLANRNYEIETKDTRLSYLPEKGNLVGRRKEVEIFKSIFSLIFDQMGDSHPNHLLIVEGKLGTGKSRLITEFKYHSQLAGIPVFPWRAFRNPPIPQELKPPFCLHIDEADHVNPEQVNQVLHQYASDKIMIIWATEAAPSGWSNAEIISLKNFSEEELTRYLTMVTGLENPPHKLVMEIFHRTDGNPLFVTELLKTLLENNLLLDASGRWISGTFEDIGINFEKIKVPQTLSGLLSKKCNGLEEGQREILTWMAIFNRPLSLSTLATLSGLSQPQSHLLFLTKEDLIERTDREQNYFFTNVLLRGVLYENLSGKERQKRHDQAASFTHKNPLLHAEYLHHVGQGSEDGKAIQALLSLGEFHLKNERFAQAISTLEEAWERARGLPDEKLKIEVEKQLAACLISGRNFKKAATHYEHLKEILDASPEKSNLEERLSVYEKTGDLYVKQDQPEKALALFDKALAWLDSGPKSRVHRMIIQNCMANVKLKSGKVEEAENIFESNHREWEKWSQDERKKVTNNWLGDVLALKGEFSQALTELTKDLAFFEQISDRYLTARTSYVMGDIHFRLMMNHEGSQRFEKKDHAIACFEKSLKLAKEIDAHDLMMRAYNGIGNVRYHQEEFERASDDYERALALARKLEDFQTAAAIALNLGNIFKIRKKYTDSYAYFIYAINTLESLPHKNAYNWNHLLKCHIDIAETYREMHEFGRAEESIAKAEEVVKSQPSLSSLEFYVWLERARTYRASGDSLKCEEAVGKAAKLAVEKQEQDELRKFKGEAVTPLEDKPAFKIMKNEKTTSELETILQINKYLNSEHDPEHLLKMVLNFALELSGAESGLVLLLNEEGGLEIKASVNTEIDPGLKQISQSVAKKAMESGEVVISADALSDERFDSSESVVMNALKSVMCLPFKSRNKIMGVLYLDNRQKMNAFDNVNIRLLHAYGDQVGIALENARLISGYQDIQKKLTDKLEKTTGELNDVKEMLETSAYMSKFSYDQIIAQSKPMREIFKVLDKVTETNLSVYLQGGSGTGKELIARALHYNNTQRLGKRFVAINCGAIPANLIESELFGHKTGSFTGATRDKKGLFEEANGGTLLLDEVAELELALQVRLLRVLQEGEVQRIGDVKPIKVDVRIVCASHKVLEDLVKQGKFREDLFYRLCQMKIVLPPLSKRTEDIPLLVEHFVEKFRETNGVAEKIKVAPALMKIFFQYTWPGNIRELENVINVACALRNGNLLDVSSLPPNYGISQTVKHAPVGAAKTEGKSVALDEKNNFDPSKTWEDYETLIIAKCFEALHFKKGETATSLSISPSTIYKKIKEYDLENKENPIYSDPFVYEEGAPLKAYIPKIFKAALKFADDHPYAAIRQLNVSQGYFYKIIKQDKQPEGDPPRAGV